MKVEEYWSPAWSVYRRSFHRLPLTRSEKWSTARTIAKVSRSEELYRFS
eukprot:COSAG01_NODE_7258_length_3279_cov_16.342453_1_plen_49_part_00